MVPATQEADAGDHLSTGGGGRSELCSYHCTPFWVTKQDSVSNKQTNNDDNNKNPNRLGDTEAYMFKVYLRQKKKF